jgi:hypothetical protein
MPAHRMREIRRLTCRQRTWYRTIAANAWSERSTIHSLARELQRYWTERSAHCICSP